MKNEKRKEIFGREFKLKFMGYGDWIDEPDAVEFEYKGLKCLVARVVKREPCHEEAYFGGHLCGYVFLPKSHPLYGKPASEVELSCWCGITYTEETPEGWMVGFDCGHSTDLVPTMAELRKKYRLSDEIFPIPEEYKNSPLFNPTYKNIDFCIKQCKSMAKQAAKMMVAA